MWEAKNPLTLEERERRGREEEEKRERRGREEGEKRERERTRKTRYSDHHSIIV